MGRENQFSKSLQNELKRLHTCNYFELLQKSCVGIAGLGGLGSNVSICLARSGIGKLILVDYDVVELGNLNRQYYFRSHVGEAKTESMRMLIEEINPGITVETHAVRITAANCATLFAATDVVVEALDEAEEKAMLIETVLSFSKNVPLVAASGIGGYGNNNAIKTERFENLFFCGDGETEVDEGVPLFAPRVALVAAMQANVVLELLLGPYEYK